MLAMAKMRENMELRRQLARTVNAVARIKKGKDPVAKKFSQLLSGNNMSKIREFIASVDKQKLNQQDKSGNTILHAAMDRLTLTVQFLAVQATFNSEVIIEEDSKGLVDIVLHLAKYCDVTILNADGRCPYDYFFWRNVCTWPQLSSPFWLPVMGALMTKSLMDSQRHEAEEAFKMKVTRLQELIHHGAVDLLRVALNKGASLEYVGDEQLTPLMFAMSSTSFNSLDIISLVTKPSLINTCSGDGSTAVHYAVKAKNIKAIQYLTSFATCSMDIRNDIGQLPMNIYLEDPSEANSSNSQNMNWIRLLLPKYSDIGAAAFVQKLFPLLFPQTGLMDELSLRVILQRMVFPRWKSVSFQFHSRSYNEAQFTLLINGHSSENSRTLNLQQINELSYLMISFGFLTVATPEPICPVTYGKDIHAKYIARTNRIWEVYKKNKLGFPALQELCCDVIMRNVSLLPGESLNLPQLPRMLQRQVTRDEMVQELLTPSQDDEENKENGGDNNGADVTDEQEEEEGDSDDDDEDFYVNPYDEDDGSEYYNDDF